MYTRRDVVNTFFLSIKNILITCLPKKNHDHDHAIALRNLEKSVRIRKPPSESIKQRFELQDRTCS